MGGEALEHLELLEFLERRWGETLKRYAEALALYREARLTGTRGAEDIYALHVRDCLASVPFLPPSGAVVDVGSGGGLPGLVWAVCRPDLTVTLVDSVRKKCRAVESIASDLGVTNLRVVNARCEDFSARGAAGREAFVLASARALARAAVTAEYLAPLVSVGGCLPTFKGPKVDEELAEARGLWKRLGLGSPDVTRYGPPDRSNVFVLWKKIAPCPAAYPRRAGEASMKGWWL